jgi:hypothetical protein
MMCCIGKKMFVYFVIKIYIIAWGDDGMVKALGCAHGGEVLNPTLDMLCLWHHDNKSQTKKEKKTLFSNNLILSLIQISIYP